MLIAQMTDLHITLPGAGTCGGAVDPADRLRRCIGAVEALDPAPDLLLLTGDLTDTGAPAEYAALLEILAATTLPIAYAIGNHDDRAVMRSELDLPPEAHDGPFLQYVVDGDDARVMELDSTAVEHHLGEFCPDRVDWLAERLAEDREQPTVLAIHHPPFSTGVAVFDGAGPAWADGLIELVGAAPNVELIVCGHVHRPTRTVLAGTLVSVCPATAHQTMLDLADAPSTDHLFVREPPAFQLHQVGDGPTRTHTVTVGDWEPLIPVDAAGRARWAESDPYALMARRPHPA